jgi:hypothetical protein
MSSRRPLASTCHISFRVTTEPFPVTSRKSCAAKCCPPMCLLPNIHLRYGGVVPVQRCCLFSECSGRIPPCEGLSQ